MWRKVFHLGLVWAFRLFGWCLANFSEKIVEIFCQCCGWLTFLFTERGYHAISQLHHAFPDRSRAWHRKIARTSLQQMFEMFFMAAAIPYLSKQRILKVTGATPATLAVFDQACRTKATVFVVPHTTLIEALIFLPSLTETPPEIHVFFRPFNQPAVDAWIQQTRERWGACLFSRKDNLSRIMARLRQGASVTLLFDQNTGKEGTLITFLGRVCSVTELPGLLARKYGLDVYAVYAERVGFWQGQLRVEKIETRPETAEVTLAINRWLECLLRESDRTCADWFWAHQRWKTQDLPETRFRLEHKRSWLSLQHGEKIPRHTRLWIRLPNWLGDVVMATPLLRALREGRPDMEVTLIGQPHFAPLLERWGLCERYLRLPARRGLSHWRYFHECRLEFPDTYLLFTNSFRGDLEAWLTRTPQRFGVEREGRRRWLLTHAWQPPTHLDEMGMAQTLFWEEYLRYFGLRTAVDRTPLENPVDPLMRELRIGLICGTENSPEKRWPVDRFQELLQRLWKWQPLARVTLFGTARDQAVCASVAKGFDPLALRNLAGRTTLPQFLDELRACHLVIGNDTGGIHLANAVGVPVLVLYGPTNPVRTGPFFAVPSRLLQAPEAGPRGGGRMTSITADSVLQAMQELLQDCCSNSPKE